MNFVWEFEGKSQTVRWGSYVRNCVGQFMHYTAKETDIQVPKTWHLDYGSPIAPVYLGLWESWGMDLGAKTGKDLDKPG